MVFFLTFLTFALFFLKGIIFLDPDLGWHLRMGEVITTSGIPSTDPFSYTMPSFPFIDHEWLTNVFLKTLYVHLGLPGLSFIYLLIASLAVYLSCKWLGGKSHYWVMPTLLCIGILFPYFGVRPQVLSWLFWAIFLAAVFNRKRWGKLRLLLPLFFIVWVNLHGSFAVGIVALALIGVFRFWEKRKFPWDFVLVFILSLLATFINPYGPRIWHEVWQQASDTSLRWSILEWQPVFFSFNAPYLFYLVYSSFLVWKNRKKFRLEELGLYFFFLFQGIGSTRHVPLWVILSLPMTIKALSFTHEGVKTIPYGQERFKMVYRWGINAALSVVVLQLLIVFVETIFLGEGKFYPMGAITYLKENLPRGEIFSEYGWGGYLIWNLPEKKVFIDGRMASWKWEDNPEQESDYVMRDYVGMLKGKISYKDVFEKYQVEVVLWPTPLPTHPRGGLSGKLEKKLFKKADKLDIIGQLKKDGWQKVYEDRVAVIYKRLQ